MPLLPLTTAARAPAPAPRLPQLRHRHSCLGGAECCSPSSRTRAPPKTLRIAGPPLTGRRTS
eukprot:1924871-Prorocentrum_lima.AAC.1